MRKFVYCLGAVLLLLTAEARASSAGQLPFFSAYPRLDRAHWRVSDGWANGDWQSCEWRADALSATHGNLRLRLSDKGGKLRHYGCAEIHSAALTRYGRYEARLRAAEGSGLNTAFFVYVGPPVGVPSHDEIDFEFLGRDTHAVEVTYWRHGKKLDHTVVPLGYDAAAAFHDYAFAWSPSAIHWYVDGRLVHETTTGAPMPDNAMRIYLSLWSGAAAENAWMGPFIYKKPATADIAWVSYAPHGNKP
ncbi:MAG: family 16 glycosylhydrolase [Alphaproteobacteria bacterium]|nr:family 16 glycosylhydrolase [Alphaproteobacteria bacterium]MDE2337478.1 family 16 glycosylhydrolase [Alphaproteobacteria bacterium]